MLEISESNEYSESEIDAIDALKEQIRTRFMSIFIHSQISSINMEGYESLEDAIEKNNCNFVYDLEGLPQEEIDKLGYIVGYINESIGMEFLNKLLISDIILDTNTTFLHFNNEIGSRYISNKIIDQLPEDQKLSILPNVYRGGSLATMRDNKNNKNYGRYFPTPISLFSHKYCNISNKIKHELSGEELRELGVEYLEYLPLNMRPVIYMLGTLLHEIGHHIYEYFVKNTENMKTLDDLISKLGNITKYADEYKVGNKNQLLNENFAEITRLYFTSYEYFRSNYPEYNDFFEKILDDIELK